MESFLYITWVVISGVLVWRRAAPVKVYGLSSILFSIPCFYSQHIHGFLEMGGVFHIAFAGLIPMVFALNRKKIKRRSELPSGSPDR
jgi:hypothetical protein